MNDFKTQNNLEFLVAEYHLQVELNDKWMAFKVGTCHGLWRCFGGSYEILAITNEKRNNGHLSDVFEWFEMSCKRDNKTLKILQVWNKAFKKHLIDKRNFKEIGDDNLEKHF